MTWQGVCKVWSLVKSGCKWRVRNEAYTRFWTDNWLPSSTILHDSAGVQSPSINLDLLVNSFVDDAGDWNFPLFQSLISANRLQEIRGLLPPMPHWALMRIRMMLWMVLKNGLKTADFLCKRRVVTESICSICVEWLAHNLNSSQFDGDGVPWHMNFAVTLWMLWQTRNEALFSPVGSPCADQALYQRIIIRILEFHSTLNLDNSSYPQKRQTRVLVRWEFPSIDYVKCNVDASVKATSGEATCGGGIYSTISSAAQLNIHHLWVESDSLCAINFILKECPDSHPCFSIVKAIRNFMLLRPNTRLSHCFREANYVADSLANHAYQFDSGLHVLNSHPSHIQRLLYADLVGLSSSRIVAS
ncbi:Ribonuclease H-like superfamily [Sesbania bispinosa]|nr:Ribonuclease H-like superfamily [Sesbania bispinosa]